MSLKKTRFIKGIILAPDSVALDSIEGEIKVDSTDSKIKVTLGSAAREVVTNSQTQELTNKTLTSPLINTGVSGTAIDLDGTLAANSDTLLASQKAVKTYVDAQVGGKDEADEIIVSPAIGGFTANVQATLQGHQDLIDDLVTLSGVAANAESLGTFTGTTIPDNSTVKAALQAIETAHEEVDQNVNDLITLSGVAENATSLGTFTGTTIPDNSTVKGALQSIETSLETKLAATGGTFTNGSVVTPARLDVKQDTLLALEAYAALLTTTNGQIVFATDEKKMYQVVDNELVSIGGAGIVKLTAGESISANDLVYISTGTGNDSARTAGRIYKVDASNDDRSDVLGFAPKAITSGAIGEVQTSGSLVGLSSLTAGKLYYASASTPGAITATPPSTNGQWVITIGLAVSATELVINPVASASAVYVTSAEASFTVANNQSSAANVTDLLFSGATTRAFSIDYSIYRQTDTSSSALAQVGQLRGVYNTQSTSWFMSDDFSGQNSGVTFTITSGGQIQYTSSDLDPDNSNPNYVGTLKFVIRQTLGV
jgi:hypothetical protein